MNRPPRDRSIGEAPDSRDRATDAIEEAIAGYLDRLHAGERIDPAAVLAEHPEIGSEVLESLEDFLDLGGGLREEAHAERTLGDYRLGAVLGRGGMGIVHDAWEGSMERRVAVKVLPAAFAADSRRVARFVREAQAAGKLRHPNVVPVFAMGVREGVPYYAMELVEGESLGRVIADCRTRERGDAPQQSGGAALLSTRDLEGYARLAKDFAGVAEGLQHAHASGVVHRDIKPSNLIFDRSRAAGSEGRLRVLDFGLASLAGEETLTVSGDFVGTPQYMSPEQARRRKVRIDHRTDVYSLGATLYEALTLRPPFEGHDYEDTLSRIIEREPMEPRRLEPRVPRDLETITLKCLRKDPGDRYGTAEALAQDLRRFARGDPIEARPVARWESAARRLWRVRARLAVGGVLVLLLASALWFAHRQQTAEHDALLAGYDERLRGAIVALLAGRFSVASPEASGQDENVYAQDAARRTARFLFVEGRGTSPFRLADVQAFFTRDGTSSIATARRTLEDLASALPEKRDGRYHLARARRLLGDSAAARREAESALAIDPSFAPARVLLWELAGEPGGTGGGELEALLARAEEDDAAVRPENRWRADWLRAYRASRRGDWKDAASSLEGLAGRKDTPYVGSELESHLLLGVAFLEAGEPVRAQASFVIARQLAGGIEPAVLLAKAYHLGGEEELAAEVIDELHARARRTDAVAPAARAADGVAVLAAAVCDTLQDHTRGLDWSRKIDDAAWRSRLEAYFLWRLRRTQEAIAAARRAIERNPRDPVALLVAGHALLEDLWSRPRDGPAYAGDVAQLLEIAERAATLDGTANSPASRLLAAAEELAAYTIPSTRDESRSESMMASGKNVAAAAAVMAGTFGLLGQAAAQVIEIGPHRGTFTDVRPVAELNSAGTEWSPSLTEDGLMVVFGRAPAGNRAQFNLWGAERDDPAESFGDPAPLETLNSEYEDNNPNISADGLTIVFHSSRPGGMGAKDLYLAVRETRANDFGEPMNLGSRINTPLSEYDGHLSPDGLRLYFSRAQPGIPYDTENDLFVAVRPSIPPVHAKWDSDDVTVQPINGVNTAAYGEGNSSVSTDEQILFFTDWLPDNPTGPGGVDIRFAIRSGPGPVDFTNPTVLGFPINTAGLDMSPWISHDWPGPDSKFWFTRCSDCSGNDIDIYEATWVPEPPPSPPFQRADANADSAVDLSDGVFILNWLFSGGETPSCLDAADTDDTGEIELTDAVALFNFLFLGGDAPPAPTPSSTSLVCGDDATEDMLDCAAYAPCASP